MFNTQIAGIYKYENLLNNKKYVGQSINIAGRLVGHKTAIKNNRESRHLQRAINKNGIENFSVEIIQEVATIIKKLTKEDRKYLREYLVPQLNYWEQYYMDLWKTYDPDKGYNLAQKAGSPLGIKWTQESKNKIKGRIVWNKGLTKETDVRIVTAAAKQSLSQKGVSKGKGRHLDEEHKKKIKESWQCPEAKRDRIKSMKNSWTLEKREKAKKVQTILQNLPEVKKKQIESKLGSLNPMYGKNPEDFMTSEAVLLKNERIHLALNGKKLTEKHKLHLHVPHPTTRGAGNPNYNPDLHIIETRICVCGCEQTFECPKSSKKRFLHGHSNKNKRKYSQQVLLEIKNEWLTGKYTRRQLAEKHSITYKYMKGIIYEIEQNQRTKAPVSWPKETDIKKCNCENYSCDKENNK